MRSLLLILLLACRISLAAETTDPTQMPSLPQAKALTAFIAKKKFTPEKLYPGAMNELDRVRFEAIINSLANELLSIADKPNAKPKLLELFKKTFPAFEYSDTEERERALDYFEELMGILGVESSDGLLNKLLYGFDPQQSAPSRNADALAAMNEDERALAAKLEALTPENARTFLFDTLGPPTSSQSNMLIWMRGAEADDVISFTSEPKAIIIWMVKNRFLFTKQL